MSSAPNGLTRSLLYVPALNARAIEKARELPADVVIVDLEDSIDAEVKDAARDAAVAALRQGFPGKVTALRINRLDTPWGHDDLKAVAAARPDVVVLPKVSGAEAVLAVSRAVGVDIKLWAMIESCRALLHLGEIAGASRASSLSGLLVGTNDLAADLRCRVSVGREAMATALSHVAIAARAYGLKPLDGPYNDFNDTGGLEIQCRQAAELGYDGKSLIHPAQIEAANRAFAPSAERIAWAREVIAVFEHYPKAAVIAVNGQMVERAMHLKEAEAVLAFALGQTQKRD
jgi:citrate lyase subunit beta/citryl-CoA lyase